MTTLTVIDTAIGRTHNNGPHVTRLYHVDEHTVRVRVARDFYQNQSHAVAEVLTPTKTWTPLCHQPPQEFFEQARRGRPTDADVQDFLLQLADRLAERAARILRVPHT